MSEVKDPISVMPVKNKMCSFDLGLDPAGKPKRCPKAATMLINGKPFCDFHAEIRMIEACGRNTKIVRNGGELVSTG